MKPQSKKGTFLVLFAAILAHAALHLPPGLIRREIRHDEAITLLAITGHQGEYDKIIHADAPPHRAWAPAGEWQRLLVMDPERPAELGRVTTDLAALDIHPPLYFWLFSLVARAFGATLGVGLALNFSLDVLTILAVYFLGKRVLRDNRRALLAACLWALSPGVLEASLELRQYPLLGLFTTLFALLASIWLDPDERLRPPLAVVLVGVCALGVLTHYHFLLLVAAGCVVAISSLAGRDLRRALSFCGASAAGVGLGLLAHPHLFEILKRQGEQAPRFALAEVPVRIGGVLVGMGRFFVWSVPLIVVWMVVLIPALLFVLFRARKRFLEAVSSLDPSIRRALALLGLTFCAQAAFFLAFRSPAGAMRAKYLVLDYPLVACIVASGLTRAGVHRYTLPVVSAVVFVSSIIFGVGEMQSARQIAPSMSVATSARKIVFDTFARGSLPVVLWNVPAETPVYAASHSEIAARPADISGSLGPGALIVTDPQRGNAAQRAALLNLVPAEYRVEEIRPAVFRDRIVYRVVER